MGAHPVPGENDFLNLLRDARGGDPAALTALRSGRAEYVRQRIEDRLGNPHALWAEARVWEYIEKALPKIEPDEEAFLKMIEESVENTRLDDLHSRALEAKRAQDEAFATLKKELERDVRRTVHRELFSSLAGETDRVVNEVFLKLYDKLDYYRHEKGDLRGYVVGFAKHAAEDANRAMRQPPEALPTEKAPPARPPDQALLTELHSAVLAEVLRAAAGSKVEPYKKLTFLFRNLEGWSPGRVWNELHKAELMELLLSFVVEAAYTWPKLHAELSNLLKPLALELSGAIGRQQLGDFCKTQRAVYDWNLHTAGSVLKLSVRQEPEFLCLVFGGPEPVHELLAYGFVKLLRWTPEKVLELEGHSLAAAATILEAEYASAYPSQKPKAVQNCFHKLDRRIPADSPQFTAFFPRRAGQVLEAALGVSTRIVRDLIKQRSGILFAKARKLI